MNNTKKNTGKSRQTTFEIQYYLTQNNSQFLVKFLV